MSIDPVKAARLDELARRAAVGDTDAVDQLLRESEPLIAARCRTMLPNALDAEEAAQDALLAVARRIGSFEGRSAYATWLYRVSSNSAIDTYRRLKTHHISNEEMPELTEDRRTSVIAGTRIDLLDAMDEVDQKFSEPVVLRDIHGLEYSDIATVLDVPVGTVKSRIHEGRRQLQRVLNR